MINPLLLLHLLFNVFPEVPAVQLWTPVEREFNVAASYSAEECSAVQLDIEFHSLNGKRLVVPAFWDGGSTWRVRFAPPEKGWWYYYVKAGELPLADEVKTGAFFVTTPTPEQITQNPNNRGFLEIANERFCYADGTPFFWLGGTVWAGNSLNMPLNTDFKHYVHDRQAKGFTVVQFKVCDPHQMRSDEKTENGRYQYRGWNENGPLFYNNCKEINPEAFLNLDNRLKMILDAGMVPVLFLHWGDAFDRLELTQLQSYYRYMIARYQAYNVIWCLSGEYAQSSNLSKIHACGRFLHELDPAGHLTTIHPGPGNDHISTVRHFEKAEWLDFHMQQTWENPERHVMLRDRAVSSKPIVNAEAGYDGLWSHDRTRVRREAWTVFMSGGAGYTYGAHGVWAWREKGPDPLRALHLQSSRDMQRLAHFFTYLGHSKLKPDLKRTDNGYCLSGLETDPIVVYLPQGGSVMVKDADRHAVAFWYNTRIGNFQPAHGTKQFTAPGTEDWALYIGSSRILSNAQMLMPPHLRRQ